MLAGVAFTAFVWVESRLAEPMMPLSLFRIRELSVANLATFFVYAALGSALFFVALFAQSVLGYSPIEAGLLFVPVSIVLWALASRFGRWSDRIGPRPFLIGGPALIASDWPGWACWSREPTTGSTSCHRCSSSPWPCGDGAGHHLDSTEAGS